MAINIDPESPEAAPETVSLDNETKKCPDCAEFIKFEAVKCRFCGKEFDPEEVKRQVTARLAELDHTGKTQCPLCKKWDVEPRQPFDKWCPHCKQAV